MLSVLKGGFLFSGRVGSGLVIARLPDGSWSAPSAIMTAGMGFGGQIGGELTDFVFVLNTSDAVKSFAQAGSVTLGGNVSIAVGPVGRNAEAAGSASLKSVAAIFSYSKTKGLFAGVSLEGSAMVERRDANSKFYNDRVTAKDLLYGRIPPPTSAKLLYSVLNAAAFTRRGYEGGGDSDSIYNDMPVYGDEDDVVWQGRRGQGYGEGQRRASSRGSGGGDYDDDYDVGDRRRPNNRHEHGDLDEYDDYERQFQNRTFNSKYSDNPGKPRSTPSSSSSPAPGRDRHQQQQAPGRPTAPKPAFVSRDDLKADEAIAQFTFQGEQDGDLSFKKGDVVKVTKKSESRNVFIP